MGATVDQEHPSYRAMREAEAQSLLRRGRLIRLGLLVLVAILIAWLMRPRPTVEAPREDRAAELREIAPLIGLERVEGGWLGVLSRDWQGAIEPRLARETCAALAAHLPLVGDETLSLTNPEGVSFAECEGS